MTRTTPPSISSVAVVGAGFSGVMTALQLLRLARVPKVYLFDRPGPFARGAAFQGGDAEPLLNVRAANMSAWPDRPLHFADWLAEQGGGERSSFATRADYGCYLQSLLSEAAEAPAAAGRLVLAPDAVVGVRPEAQGWRIETAMGRQIAVEAVCLAVGNLPPRRPAAVEPELVASGRFINDPWRWDPAELAQSDEDGPILLIGSGLTMVDVALAIHRHAPTRRLLAVSRHGLAPHAHDDQPPAPPDSPPEERLPSRLVRALRRRAARRGWRATVDSLRPHVQDLWRGWSEDQRASFLRHCRAYWDVHRHRLAPTVAARIASLQESGLLAIVGGRLEELALSGEGVAVRWRPRTEAHDRDGRFALVVNCTGPSGDIAQADDPLLRQLLADGCIRPDPLGLGADCDASSRLIRADGRIQARLFGVGPITRGAHWEITAVPDIRIQVQAVAQALSEYGAPRRARLSGQRLGE